MALGRSELEGVMVGACVESSDASLSLRSRAMLVVEELADLVRSIAFKMSC